MTSTQPPGARWWPWAGMFVATATMLAIVLATAAAPAHADPHLPDASPGATPAAPAPPKAEPTPPPSINEPTPGLTPTPPVKETPRPQPTPATPSPGPAPSPPPETGGGDGGDSVSFWDIPGQIRQAITHWLADLIRPLVTPLINSLVRGLLTMPNPAEQPRVIDLWEAMRLISVAGYGLFVLAAGITTMSHGSVQQRWSAQDVIPRLVLGIAASNLSLTICSTTLTLANALAEAIFGDGITADDVAGTLIGLILTQFSSTTAPLYMLVFTLAVVALGSSLLITVLVRTAATIILTVASPLMLVCHAHPGSDGIARLWWRAYLGCLGTEIAQAIIFLVCVKALLDPGNYGLIPIPDAAALINLMLLCCTLYLLIKVPGWIRRIVTTPARTITGGGGPRIGGLRILRKIALGALGMPMGPYAFGAQLAGRFRAARAARAASATAPASGPGPNYTWGRPRRNGPGPGGPGSLGGPGGGPPRGGPGSGGGGAGRSATAPAGGPGTHPGPNRPPAGPGSQPGTGPGSTHSYQWGHPRKRTPGNRLAGPNRPPAPRIGPALPPGGPKPNGSSGPKRWPPQPLPRGASGPTPPPPAVRPTAASNLRPARANLPPPLPRPAVLRPPLDDDPPGARRGRKPR